MLKLPLTLAIIQVLVVRVARRGLRAPARHRAAHARGPAAPTCIASAIARCSSSRGEQMPLDLDRRALELELGGPPVDSAAPSCRSCSSTPAGRPTRSPCERLLGKREIVLKSLGALLADVPCAAGATLHRRSRRAHPRRACSVVQRGARARAGAARRSREQRRSPPAAPSSGAPRILLAEDSDIVRERCAACSRAHGYEVVTARDGARRSSSPSAIRRLRSRLDRRR